MKHHLLKSIAVAFAVVIAFSLGACSSGPASSASQEIVTHGSSTDAVVDVAKGEGTGEVSSSLSEFDYASSDRLLIRNVSITIETETFTDTYSNIIDAVNNSNGYIENSELTGTGTTKNLRHATLVIRVPADEMDALIASLDGQGTVTFSSESVEDVTLDYVDIEGRISSLQTELDSLEALVEQAEDIDTILELQDKISEVRYSLETYQSSLLVMQNRISYSTLTLNVSEVLEEQTELDSESAKEITLWDKMRDAFLGSINFIITVAKGLLIVASALLPVAVVVGIPVAVIVIIVKLRKKKKAQKYASDPQNKTKA